MEMFEILNMIEGAVAEVPEAVGKALTFVGQKLEELAARIEALEHKA
jgi:hypothetical protein